MTNKNDASAQLRRRIEDLKQKQQEQGRELESYLYQTLDGMRPINIIRSMFSDLVDAAKPSIANAAAIISAIANVYAAFKKRNDEGTQRTWLQSLMDTISHYFSDSAR